LSAQKTTTSVGPPELDDDPVLDELDPVLDELDDMVPEDELPGPLLDEDEDDDVVDPPWPLPPCPEPP
jgi:hypothetical protein